MIFPGTQSYCTAVDMFKDHSVLYIFYEQLQRTGEKKFIFYVFCKTKAGEKKDMKEIVKRSYFPGRDFYTMLIMGCFQISVSSSLNLFIAFIISHPFILFHFVQSFFYLLKKVFLCVESCSLVLDVISAL